MAYVGKNPNFNTTILDNQGAGGVSNAPTGKVKLINRDGQILTKDDAGNESTLGGGGLEVVYEAGPTFTAEAGKHYRCTSAVTGVTMPEITADIAQIAFSPSEGAEWSTNAITVTPHSSQYIDRDNGSVADETFKLNMSGVDTVTMTSKFSTLNWEVDTPITPSNIGNGAIITEWQSYTPSNTQGFGTITSRLQWRQVGSSIEIKGDFTSGTCTGDEAQLELPNSYTVALRDTTGTAIVGQLYKDITDSNLYKNVLATDGDTYINFADSDRNSNKNQTSAVSGVAVINNSTRGTLYFSVPVQELTNSGTTTLTASDFSAKTEWVDLGVTGISGDNGFSNVESKAKVYRDSNGQYSFEFQITGTRTSNTTNTNIDITGVTFKSITGQNQQVSGYSDDNLSFCFQNTNTINLAGGSAGTGGARLFGHVLLEGKPTWFDDYAENSFDMDLHFQEATPTVLGLVKASSGTYNPVLANVDMTTLGTAQTFSYLQVGDVVHVGGQITGQNASAGQQFTIDLPIDPDSNFPDEFHANGSGHGNISNDGNQFVVVSNSGSKLVKVNYRAATASGAIGSTSYTFTYRLR